MLAGLHTPVSAQSLAQRNAGLRSEIDAKRMVTDITSPDALPRSREFLRIDSTYYVGPMYEGSYKYEHAADYVGYRNASVPLERALNQLERDYRRELGTRTSDLMTFIPAFRFQVDYTQIAYNLLQCYMNMEEPDKAYALLRRVLRWNLQRDLYLDAYNYLAWITHRNRFYTSARYSFLKNSIDENEQLANRYLDSGLARIARNKLVNSTIFPPGYEKPEILAVDHYKCVLYSYALNVDSAMHYYEQMREAGALPHNNYATFRAVCGDFREAEAEYKIASGQDAGDKRLQEWAYYTSILDIYKGQPKLGARLSRGMIQAAGSTPGFGWYNIALARSLYYDGQVQEAERISSKAAEFKELHIGTTLGQSHYDFSIQLNKLMTRQARWSMERFEHRNWWYNPKVLATMTGLLGEKYLQQFLIINQFAQNPERDRVIYKLFSTESTVSWDEIWSLIGDFSTNYFLQRFQDELKTDKREPVRKYFKYFIARLKIKQGEYKEARTLLNEVLMDNRLDATYEKLLLARTYQALALCAAGLDEEGARNDYLYRAFREYPQLLPFSGMKTNMRLHTSGQQNDAVASRIRDCNINWTEDRSIPAPDAFLVFSKASNTHGRIEYWVIDASGNYLVPKQAYLYEFKKPEEAGVQMAYRLFGVGGTEPAEAKEESI